MTKEEMLQLLRQDVVPALGCTEPVCIALAAADAVKAVGGTVKSIQLELSPNVYKNAMSVGIPGFHKVGLKYAAALGAYIANPAAGLEIMKGITPANSEAAVALAENGSVGVSISPTQHGVYVRCEVTTSNGTGVSVIQGSHTNIVLTQANGVTLHEKDAGSPAAGPSLSQRLNYMPVAEIRALAASATEEELSFLEDGIKMNQTLAQYGIDTNPGIGISHTLNEAVGTNLLGSGLLQQIMLRVASATEARLEGCPYSTMSSAGSGSKGISVILPVSMVAQAIGADRKTTLQALAFAHLLNNQLNNRIGKLSAICACAMAAAPSACAAITWLLGGNDQQIGWAIRNMSGTITGMICDGGKVGCSLKLATAAAAGLMNAILAVNQVALRPTDGICGDTPEDCIQNMSRVSIPGMLETDVEILNIMLDKGQTK